MNSMLDLGVQHGPVLALICILVAIANLGWDRALQSLDGRPEPLSRFSFQPRLIAPWVLLLILGSAGALCILRAAQTGNPLIFVLTPLALIGTYQAAMMIARWRYIERLRNQVSLAVAQLMSLTSSSTSILSAFRSVTQASEQSGGWPLSEEWRWVEQHVNKPYVVHERGMQTRMSDHAYALRALAKHTPLDMHAQVLGHLAAIYEQGAQSQAAARLRLLVEVIDQQAELARQLTTQLSGIKGQAYTISGAIGFIAILALLYQPERVSAAFLESPFGMYAAAWFLFWFSAPIIAGVVLSRPPDLPL